MIYSLYILKHPETLETIYVGVTTNIRIRKNAHRHVQINKNYFYPIMDVVMTFSNYKMAFAVERNTIESLKKIGVKLNNSDRYTKGYIKKVA